jgi:hypothetical protein
MPTWEEHLNAALEQNCHRIADLCEIREAILDKYDARIASSRDLDEMISLSLSMSKATTVVDAEIELLSQGSKKLMRQLEVLA